MSSTDPQKIYSFDNFRLDPSKKLLVYQPTGESVPITGKSFELLLILIENHGELLTKNELMDRIWKDSFVEEANLTQTISVLRKILGENPNQHRFIVTESGKGYRFVAEVIESEENRLAQETSDHLTHEKLFSGQKTKQNLLAISGLLAAAVFLTAVFVYLGQSGTDEPAQPASARDVQAIAVLPFQSITNAEEDKILGVGMADAVITKLSRLKSIRVRQTNTVLQYANSTPEAIKIGREINVDAVLEGNIQRADGRIRVSVHLFRVKDNSLLWAENFDELDSDIFTLQDSISERVAGSLSLTLNRKEQGYIKKRHTNDIEAFQLYNKGRLLWNNRNEADLRKSISFFEQAIAKDPNYALAYSGLAEAYVLLHTYGQRQEKDAFPRAFQAAQTALSLDEDLAEAHNALAMYKEQYERDWAGAERAFKQALIVNPSYAPAHQWYGEFLAFMGRIEESIIEVEKAHQLDPQSLSTNTARAFPYLAGKQYDQSIEKLNEALELEKDFPLALYYLGRCYTGKGHYEVAIEFFQKAIEASGGSTYFSSALIYAYRKNGQFDEAREVFSKIIEQAGKQPVSSYILARSYAGIGEKEKALDALEKGLKEQDSLMVVTNIEQNFDDLRPEPRFRNLLKELNF